MSSTSDPSTAADAAAFGARVDQMARAAGSRMQAAEVAGITVQQLGRIVSGRTPGASAVMLGRLAQATGFNLHWVVTGEGSPRRGDSPAVPASPPLDARFFGRVTNAVHKAYKEAGVRLDYATLGEIAATEFQPLASLPLSEDGQIAVANGVKDKLSKRLAAESLSERKRGA